MSGRTIWLAKDADWHLREWLVELGEEFGPVGPLAIDWLECAAKRQNAAGHVKAGARALARGVYSDVVTVCHVVSRAVTLGLLTDYEDNGGLFECRISWWPHDQERALAASRKAKQRAGNTGDSRSLSRSVTGSHAKSQNVPLQDRTGQDIEEADASIDAMASIVADLFAYWKAATRHPQAKLTKDRRAKIEARLREGYTAEQIRQAIDGAARAAFVNESGKRFDDIELICRSGSKLESFIDRGNPGPSVAGSVTRIGPRPNRPSAGDLIDEIRANAGAA